MKKILCFGVFILLILSLSGIALAEGSYNLSWWTVDGGGGTSSNGNGYILHGTLGQTDAGTVACGGGYTLAGGFWHGGAMASPHLKLYLPLLTK